LAENPSCNPLCRVCHYKNLDYPTQLKRKQHWAEDQLKPWKSAIRPIVPAPEKERLAYRSKSWMKCSIDENEISFGMFRSIRVQGKWEKEFVSWDSCPLHTQSIQLMIENIRAVLAHSDIQELKASLVGVWMGTPHLVIVSTQSNIEFFKHLNWNKILVLPFNRVWFHWNSQVGRKIFGHHPIELIFGDSEDRAHPIRAFRQIAQGLLVEARSQAMDELLQDSPSLILDLYCGTGELSLLLPLHTGWIGIEASQEAVKHANSLRQSETTVHSAFVGTVEQRLSDPKVLNRLNCSYALYINPPRSGLTEDAQEKIFRLMRKNPPKSIVYLSCSASSLSRALREFEGEGYRVKFLQPYDFFPQTEHFETLAVMRKEFN
jgi:23S rRNA (uracil1939-C5)-methyltransferase